MIAVILTIHVLIVLGLIGLVLLQRSEGGALGIGGGGGGGLMSGRGAANLLTRLTSVSAALFFATSLGLAMIAGTRETQQDVVDELTGTQSAVNEDGEIDAEGLLRQVGTGLDAPTASEETTAQDGVDPLQQLDGEAGTLVAPTLEELEAADPLSSIATETPEPAPSQSGSSDGSSDEGQEDAPQ